MPTNAPLKIRAWKDKKILLLGCSDLEVKGKIALGRYPCHRWHIAITTQGFQHPGCIEIKLSNDRRWQETRNPDSKMFSKVYKVLGGPGEFDLLVRWVRGHSPYPEIKDMEVWAFNIYLGEMDFPKAPDDFKSIAHIVIADDGRVTVNERDAGIWAEFAIEEETEP